MQDKNSNLDIESVKTTDWFDFSIKGLIAIIIAIILFGGYISSILYGENSLLVLQKLQAEEKSLKDEMQRLKEANQKLQKEYFELLQLTGD